MNIVLQNIIFPKKDICSETNLYYRVIGFPVGVEYTNDFVKIGKNVRVNFDTYFNSFSIEKWLKYTKVDNVKLHIKAKGSFVVELMHFYIKDDNVVFKFDQNQEIEVNSNEIKDYYVDYVNSDVNIGMFSFCIKAKEDSEIFSITYETDIDKSKISYVKMGIGTCTYKREDYIRKNMEMLSSAFLENKKSELYNHLEVFISDNAKTLSEEKWPSKKIHYFKNKNAGGSGGFTRTMMEVINANDKNDKFTHIILMDDDLTYESESIFRTYKILTLLKDEFKDSFVCGSMLRTDNMTIQHEAGCHWGNGIIISYKHNFDLAWPRQCCDNEKEDDYQYFGWWFCAMPMSIVRKDNLSLPMFIKIDDAEYGMRNLTNAIYLNGICVWHEPFEFKFTPTSAYYIARNTLICNAVRGTIMTEKEAIGHLRNYFYSTMNNLRYLCFDLFCDGVLDYLKGFKYIKDLDLEAMHKKLIEKCSEYKYKKVNELPIRFNQYYFDFYKYQNRPITKKIGRVLSRLTFNGLLLPSNKIVFTDTTRYEQRALFRAKKVYVYEEHSKTGFILKRSLKYYLHCLRKYRYVVKMFKKYYSKVNSEFEKNWKSIVTYDYWKEKLGIK